MLASPQRRAIRRDAAERAARRAPGLARALRRVGLPARLVAGRSWHDGNWTTAGLRRLVRRL